MQKAGYERVSEQIYWESKWKCGLDSEACKQKEFGCYGYSFWWMILLDDFHKTIKYWTFLESWIFTKKNYVISEFSYAAFVNRKYAISGLPHGP